ncbi:acyl-protein synthetase [Magnetospirillum sp. SS-4]|uniref:LuxE/PaaK family acyltransferase n=1 Tax=Magnetospirillum sp. SS-4 TaxID=2681465 RepID=UPI00137CEDE0|nr:acyl-protein synthetase [Magnetospirillum sp. SS-4]CAA7618042.1 conserved hypothetical protein [Magnetospirillum sp. SS-4]
MTPDLVLTLPPFGHAQADKESWLRDGLAALTAHHRAACPAYDRWVGAMFPGAGASGRVADQPWLPVGVFKTHMLSSVPERDVVRILASSGTSGQAPSRVPLDAVTAARQARALSGIMPAVLGRRRLPMLIIDNEDSIASGAALSARGAGILGMMPFGRHHAFALDRDLSLRREAVDGFLDRWGGEPFLVFGFTFMVWTHLPPAMAERKAALANAILVHGGGWKALAGQGVDNDVFKAVLRRDAGLERAVSFYGMAEQVGSVFLEGDDGLLHAPAAADVIIRDPRTWDEVPVGVPGVIQVVSLLPTSYPGHSILTEDMGVIETVDRGEWKGKAFRVLGRVPRAEPRGCSDALAAGGGR